MPAPLRRPFALGQQVVRRAAEEATFLGACTRAGLFRLGRPGPTIEGLRVLPGRGPLGSVLALSVAANPDRLAIVDDRRSVTYREFDEATNALANAWRAAGVRAGDGVGIMVRNHAGFLEALFACVKLGAKAIFLNTSFSGPQLAEVSAREGVALLVLDDEFVELAAKVDAPAGVVRAWTTDVDDAGPDTIRGLTASADTGRPPAPEREASLIILTSGTTGTPKGATRPQPKSLAPFGGPLAAVPWRSNETTVLPTPMFHGIGLLHALIAIGLGSTVVVRQKFDPKQTLADLAEHRASGLVVVPVMLRRLLDAYDEQGRTADLSALRVVLSGGSQLGAALARRTREALGDVVYNLYGSTEVAIATIASPVDLAVAPDCVGRVVPGSRVRILDDDGDDVPAGTTGRVFVGTAMPFQGYTGGGGKDVIDGLLSSGDVGHFDDAGRLTIDGRDDDMIVSGGENVFPGELEELLGGHPDVAEAAVVGVDDEDFGQRLRAYVALEPGASLDEEAVQRYAKDNLARYKVPREVIFLDELPRNPTGKIAKRELPEPSA